MIVFNSSLSDMSSSLSDSGWIELTTNVFYRKKNGFVTLNQFNHNLKSASPNGNQIGVLPEGYRPKHIVICSSFNGGGSWIQINNSGIVLLMSTSGALDTRGIVTFPVDD